MENTETKTQTLLERFMNAEEKVSKNNNGEERRWYPERSHMEHELGRLLSNEINSSYMLKYTIGTELIEEYKQFFEWDSEYSVRACWEITPSTYTNFTQCSSVEEIQEYLTYEKDLETPYWFEDECDGTISYGCDLTGENDLEARITVSNLRIKREEAILLP